MTTQPPIWFQKTLDTKPISIFHDSAYGLIHTLRWGHKPGPTVICLHGAHANAYWFSALASALCDQTSFLAIDLPGHGQSHWHDHYSQPMLLESVTAVCNTISGPIILIGHSFGGRLALEYLLDKPKNLAGVCLLDPPGMHLPGAIRSTKPALPRTHTMRTSKQAVVERFRIIPPQPIHHPYFSTYIANHSVVDTPEGWRWQFDPNFFLHMDTRGFLPADPALIPSPSLPAPLMMLYGEHTTVTDSYARSQLQQAFPALDSQMIPHAYHALMLDQPEILQDHVQSLCSQWLPQS